MIAIHPQQQYFAFLEQGKFMIQRAPGSGRHVFYPRVAEPFTGAELEWVEASGEGVVHSVSVVRQKAPATDYAVVLVDLKEGPRMMSRVDGLSPEAVRIGLPVKARVLRESEKPIVVFFPVDALLGAAR